MPAGSSGRVTVVSGGTNGMGRALALARLARGDQVVAIGSDPAKGRALGDAITFLRADLTSIADTRRVIAAVLERWPVVDALALFANRQAPARISTVDGLEATFALYYLSRHLLSHGLRDALDRAPTPVIVNVAGVGITKGSIQWTDLQLRRRYRMITAQLQAARANDLLGVDFAATSGSRARYVLYHPGFTRSGDLSGSPPRCGRRSGWRRRWRPGPSRRPCGRSSTGSTRRRPPRSRPSTAAGRCRSTCPPWIRAPPPASPPSPPDCSRRRDHRCDERAGSGGAGQPAVTGPGPAGQVPGPSGGGPPHCQPFRAWLNSPRAVAGRRSAKSALGSGRGSAGTMSITRGRTRALR